MDKKAQIKDLIAKNRISEAIKLLKEELGDEVIALENQWNTLAKGEMLGTISFSDAGVQRNKIVSALLTLTNEIGEPGPVGPRNGKKVFISYNHRDRPSADRVVAFLTEKGFAVTIDHKDLLGGRDIEDWITECLRTHDFVVSLVSENSLKSGWVGMESVMTFFAEKLREESAQFIAMNLQEEVFQPDFLYKVMKFLKEDLADVENRLNQFLAEGFPTESLQSELNRKRDHFNNLGKIADRLQRCKTIHADGPAFEKGLEELAKALA